jgi:hypothetical protein
MTSHVRMGRRMVRPTRDISPDQRFDPKTMYCWKPNEFNLGLKRPATAPGCIMHLSHASPCRNPRRPMASAVPRKSLSRERACLKPENNRICNSRYLRS